LTSALILSGFLGGGSMALADTDPALPCHSSYDEGTDILELPCVELTPSEIYGRATLKRVSPKEVGGPFTFEVVGWTPDLKGNLGSTAGMTTIGSVIVPNTLTALAIEIDSTINPQFDDTLVNLQAATRYNNLNLFNSGNKTGDVLELAAFLANTSHETGHAYQGTGSYKASSELICSDGKGQTIVPTDPGPTFNNCTYTDLNWVCNGALEKEVASGGCTWKAKPNSDVDEKIWMYGRGALQLSWNGNYEQFADSKPGHGFGGAGDLGGQNDPTTLITGGGLYPYPAASPLIWSSATWFWGNPWGPGKDFPGIGANPTLYLQTDPMGVAIRAINPSECYTTEGVAPKANAKNEALDRIDLFNKYAQKLATLNGVDLSAYTQDGTKSGPLYAGYTCLTDLPKPAVAGRTCILFSGSCENTCGVGNVDTTQVQWTESTCKNPLNNYDPSHNYCGGPLWPSITGGKVYVKCTNPK
ncbi:MAG: hypothetical protein ABGZ19_03695, partial [Verrucomicrobiales bacterium]